MRYKPGHREETKRRIVEAASLLLVTAGPDLMTIDRIMLDAGLTRGAFYNHFATKMDLVSVALEDALHRFTLTHCGGAAPDVGAARTPAEPDAWALINIATKIVNADPPVREAFTRALQNLTERMTADMGGRYNDAMCRAIVALAVMAGSSALARAVCDEALSSEIQDAGRRIAANTLQHGC
jgi:TetR/AcrR family transcriptional repressor of nem operon